MSKQANDTRAGELADDIAHELALCRAIFERLPQDMLGWAPHLKSPGTGALAAHIADMAEWIGLAATTVELDYANRSSASFEPATVAELLSYFDARASGAAGRVRALSDAALRETWTVRHGARIFFARARESVIRVDSLSHIIHHRGQLTVYCRLRDVILPGIYGPNSDD